MFNIITLLTNIIIAISKYMGDINLTHT